MAQCGYNAPRVEEVGEGIVIMIVMLSIYLSPIKLSVHRVIRSMSIVRT